MQQRFAIIAVPALFALALVAGCGGYVKPRPHALDARAQSFLESRSRPSAAVPAGTEAVERPAETVDLTGLVERPGKLAIEPSLQTLRQALDAAGGTTPTAALLRIRPGDDVLSKLFAQEGGNVLVEVPLAALGDTPIYLRPGDVIEVAAVENPPAVVPPPLAEASASPPTPVPDSAAPSASVAAAPVPASVPPAQSTTPPLAAATAEQPRTPGTDEGALRVELAKVRAEFEGKLATLRAEIEKLNQDQSKLIARLERAQTATATPPMAAKVTASKPTSVAAAAEKSAPNAKTEARSEPRPSTRPATVLVSGSVRSPGVYPIDEVKTVGGAVRAAGDRADANLSAVEVRPEGQRGALVGMGLGLGAAPVKTVVNLVAAESGKGGDVPLRGGEVIFVPASPRSEQVR